MTALLFSWLQIKKEIKQPFNIFKYQIEINCPVYFILKMKKIILLLSISILTSCDIKPQKSEKEIQIEQTKETVLKAYYAALNGDIELWKTFLSDDFTFTLTGQLDVSKTYNLEEWLDLMDEFSSLLKGEIGQEVTGILSGENEAVIFMKGEMEGVGGKYENDYAMRYTLNSEGKISSQKEWMSDLLFVTQLYGQEICGEKKTIPIK